MYNELKEGLINWIHANNVTFDQLAEDEAIPPDGWFFDNDHPSLAKRIGKHDDGKPLFLRVYWEDIYQAEPVETPPTDDRCEELWTEVFLNFIKASDPKEAAELADLSVNEFSSRFRQFNDA